MPCALWPSFAYVNNKIYIRAAMATALNGFRFGFDRRLRIVNVVATYTTVVTVAAHA